MESRARSSVRPDHPLLFIGLRRTVAVFLVAIASLLPLSPLFESPFAPFSVAFAATFATHLNAEDIDGDGAPNAGDICAQTTTTWQDSSAANIDGTLTNFTLPCAATSGWDGSGSAADPYVLKFDGANDYVALASLGVAPKSFSLWFNAYRIDATARYVLGDNSNNNTLTAYVQGGSLTVGYNSTTRTTAIGANTWYHLAVANDGTTTRFYLNGRQFDQATVAAETTTTITYRLGSLQGTTGFYQGQIGSARIYSDTLTTSEIEGIYLKEKARFFADPTVTKISRVVPAVADVQNGDDAVNIFGWQFQDASAVTINGVNVTSFTVESGSGKIVAQVPRAATMNAGSGAFQTVKVTTPQGIHAATGSFVFTTTNTGQLLTLLDAANVTGTGANGTALNTNQWHSLVSGQIGALSGFTLPSSATSGWRGTGVASDPYRLQFDGINDRVYLGAPNSGFFRGFSVWFKADMSDSTVRYILGSSSNLRMAAYVYDGTVGAYYNAILRSTGVVPGQWYNLTVTNDGTNARYYLNGREFGVAATSTITSATTYALGYIHSSEAGFFRGSIGSFRMWSNTATLTAQDAEEIFNEEKPRYFAESSVTRINRINPGVAEPISDPPAIVIQGWAMTGATAVTINGQNVTSFTIDNDQQITIQAPRAGAAFAGTGSFVDVTVTGSQGTATATGAFLYTTTNTGQLIAWFDAANVTGTGAKASSTLNTAEWRSIINGTVGSLSGFTLPSSATSGWRGTGTSDDPHRLQFDGVDDRVMLGFPNGGLLRGFSLWFKADTIDGTVRYMLGSSSNSRSAAYVYDGTVGAYYNGTLRSTGIVPGQWYNLTVTNDGTNAHYYLNGRKFAIAAIATNSAAASNALGYIHSSNANFFRGSIASFRMWSNTATLTPTDVATIFNEESHRFFGETQTTRINRVNAAVAETISDPPAIIIQGFAMTGATAVTINGQNVTSFTIDNDRQITVQAARAGAAFAGTGSFVDVTVTGSQGTATATGAFLYTTTNTGQLVTWLDAANVTGTGAKGTSLNTQQWSSVVNGAIGSLSGFTLPSSATSGWRGTGTSDDPYRLQFDGIDDRVELGAPNGGLIRGFSVWFKADLIDSTARYVLGSQSNNRATIYVQTSQLAVLYNNQSCSTGIAPGQWYNLTLTNDNTNAQYYLNGRKFCTQAIATISAGVSHFLGYNGTSGFFRGAISSFRMWSSTATFSSTDAATIFNEESHRYIGETQTTRINRVNAAIAETISDPPAIIIQGFAMTGATAVTINGQNVTSFTIDNDRQITIQAPRSGQAFAGTGSFVDVTVTGSQGTATATGAFLYTTTNTGQLVTWLDAANVTGTGAKGTSLNTRQWSSMVNGTLGSLTGFTLPSSATSGWRGTGSSDDPYRLEFDGIDDRVELGAPNGGLIRGFSVWFKADLINSTPRYILGAGSNSRAVAYVDDGMLVAIYNNSARWTGIVPGQWYNLTVTNDNTTARFYLNGREFGSVAITTITSGTYHSLGFDATSTGFFRGSIASFRMWSNTASFAATDAAVIFNEEKHRYFTETATTRINRITPAVSDMNGDSAIRLEGFAMTGATAVTINGVNATAFTIDSDRQISVQSARGAVAGASSGSFVNVQVTGAQGTAAATGGLLYTATNTGQLLMWFDAANITGTGAKGLSHVGQQWWSMAYGSLGALSGFTLPSVSYSGWRGAGTSPDPYRLQFDGVDDRVALGFPAYSRGFSVWFRADTIDSTARYILGDNNVSRMYAYVQNGTLTVLYNGQSKTSSVSAGLWYHLMVTNNGTTALYYLNGTQFGTATIATMSSGAPSWYLGTISSAGGNFFKGAIASFRFWSASASLAAADVTTIYNEEKSRFPNNATTVAGTVYTDEGTTGIAAGKRVNVSLNGTAHAGSGITVSGGYYSTTLTGAALTGGTIMAIYLDGATEDAVTVTLGSGSSMTGMHLYQDRLIIRSDSGSTAITNTTLNLANNNGDADITSIYNVSAVGGLQMAADKELYVWSGDTYVPGNTVRTHDLEVKGTMAMGRLGYLTVTGSLVANAGTFTTSTGITLGSTANSESLNLGTNKTHHLTINNGLGGYWRLDEGTGSTVARDSSGNGNNGTLTGGPTWSNSAPGMRFDNQRSVRFDGSDDYIAISDVFDPSAYTVSAWVRAADVTSVGILLRTDSSGPGTSVSHDLRINATSKFEHYTYDGGARSVISSTSASANTWYHVAGTAINGGAMRLYVNGVPEGTPYSPLATLWTGGDRYRIGSSETAGAGTFGYFQGNIDDVRIYRRVLAASEILRLAQGYQDTGSGVYLLGSGLDVNGNIDIVSGTLDVSASNHPVTATGSWRNVSGFTQRSGTVTLDGTGNQTVSGATVFHNLSATGGSAHVLFFDYSGRQSVSGSLVLRGTNNSHMNLRSTRTGSGARIDLDADATQNATDLQYLNIKDSNADMGQTLVCLTASEGCLNLGGNTNWNFGSNITIAGTVYTDEGVTGIASGKRVSVSLNGAAAIGSGNTISGGYYIASLTGATLTGGTIMAIYLDGASEDAVTVTLGSGSSMTGMHLYQDRLIVRSDSGSSPLTNTHLNAANSLNDADINSIYNVDSSNTLQVVADKELYVWSGKKYMPGARVKTHDLEVKGTLALGVYGLTVTGTLVANAGTLTTSTGILVSGASNAETLTLGSNSTNNLSINHGLVAYYRFDEGLGVSARDSTGNSTGGTVLGGAVWSGTTVSTIRFPNRYSMQFDGINDYIALGGNRDLINPPKVTVMGWMKPRTTHAGALIATALFNTNKGYEIFAYTDGSVYFDLGNGSTYGRATSSYTAGVWTHIAGTYDGTNLKIYKNGTRQATTALAGSLSVPTATMGEIGHIPAYGNFFNGLLDDIRVYNRALNASEISRISSGYMDTGSGVYTLGSALDVNGNLTLLASTLDVSGTNYGITATGSWTNFGAFTKQAGTVTLDGTGNQTMSGITVFNALSVVASAARTLFFDYSGRQSASGSLILNGTSAAIRLSLRSTRAGSGAKLDLDPDATQNATDLQYLDVMDSHAGSGQTLVCTTGAGGEGCVDSGNNINWSFAEVAAGASEDGWFHFFDF